MGNEFEPKWLPNNGYNGSELFILVLTGSFGQQSQQLRTDFLFPDTSSTSKPTAQEPVKVPGDRIVDAPPFGRCSILLALVPHESLMVPAAGGDCDCFDCKNTVKIVSIQTLFKT
ncbi:hypothetical protein ILYODFUR_021022 [Ilyodon furcidens]|uniref:Uncharacterized protein n=1 Tax=Ilyodon furcidens TaxID=33524 RepID=A0ABV0T1G7_9TELE